MPGPESDFAAYAAQVCVGFRADEPPRRARKSELLYGELDGKPVVAKRVLKANPVWEWYLEREMAVYRALMERPPGIRFPRLYAAEHGVLVIERLPGEPLATKRRPAAALPIRTISALISIHDQLAAWAGKLPPLPPSPRVRAQLRERLLEDPTSTWIRDGVRWCGRRGVLDETLARNIDETLGAYAPVAFGHGDLLLRNVIADDDDDVGLVDWECAGTHTRDWDLALLWTQLAPAARTIVEDAVRDSGIRWRAFLGLVVFALARELKFLDAFGPGSEDDKQKLRSEIVSVAERIAAA
jgi:aminoglycoside phosphotransferase